METYSRKRLKGALRLASIPSPSAVAMVMDEEKQNSGTTAAQLPILDQPPSSEPMDESAAPMENHVRQGFLYEIDHLHLPPISPPQLRSIRVAMVCEKTDVNVAIRFPSMASLKAFFNYSKRETHPTLDEKFVMSSGLAAKVLFNLVPPQVFSEEKSSISFWLVDSPFGEVRDVEEKKGICLSVLKELGMVNWGVRRQVKHLGRHMENECSNGNAQNSSTSAGSEKEEKNVTPVDGNEDCEDEAQDEVDCAEDEVQEEEGDNSGSESEEHPDGEEVMEANGNLKRKRYSFRNLALKKPKEEKREFKNPKPKSKPKKHKSRTRSKDTLIPRDPKGRWSAERYKLAEKNLLEVMRVKGARAEKPILRPQLRAEARKKIGDTGLLDHLLKHMAGKLAPGDQERFRRRHNPDGAMEYWLESADLVNIRKEAGVSDPYWFPPPGWKLGDSPNQDPICARELKLLKDEISQLRSQLEMMASKMQLKEEVEKLWRELEKVNSGKKQQEYGTTLISSLCNFGLALDSVESCNDQIMATPKFVEEIEVVKNTHS